MKKNILMNLFFVAIMVAGNVQAADSYTMPGVTTGNFDFYAVGGVKDVGSSHTDVLASVDFTAGTGQLNTNSFFQGVLWVADVAEIYHYDGAVGGATQNYTFDVTYKLGQDADLNVINCSISANFDGCTGVLVTEFTSEAVQYSFTLSEGQFALGLFFDWSINLDIPVLAVFNIIDIAADGSITTTAVDSDSDGAPGTAMLKGPFPGQTPAFSGVFSVATQDAPITAVASPISISEDASGTLTKSDFVISSTAFPSRLYTAANTSLVASSGTGYTVTTDTTITPVLNRDTDITVPVGLKVSNNVSATFDAAIGITALNDAPVITSGAPSTIIAQGGSYNYATLVDDPDTVDTLSYSLTGEPSSWMSIDASGVVSGIPGPTDIAITNGIVITVTDAAGLTDTVTFNVNVTNVNDAPVITSTLPVCTVAQDALFSYSITSTDADAGDTAAYTLSVNKPSWLSVTGSNGSATLSGTPTAADVAVTSAIVLTVTDGSGDTATQTFACTVTDVPDAPVITNSPGAAPFDVVYSYVPVITDADGDTLFTFTRSADALPTWLTFNSVDGSFTGTAPGISEVGSVYTGTITVEDASALTDVINYSITVTGINTAPTITSALPPSAINEGDAYSFTVTSNDPDAGDTATYSLIGAPAWLSIDPATGDITGTPGPTDVALTSDIQVVVTDSATATDSQTFSVDVVNVNNAPVITSSLPTASVAQDAAYSFNVTSSDGDAGDTLVYSLTGEPSWMSIDSVSGVISGTPGSGDIATTTGITIIVTDLATATGSQSFDVEVTNVNDAPSIIGTPVTTIAQGALYSFTVSASDPDAGDTLTLSITGNPLWMNINIATGVVSGNPGNADVGIVSGITISVTDAAGLQVSLTPFDVEVINVNDAPTITVGNCADVAIEAGTVFTDCAPSANDIDSNDTLAFSVTGLPASLSMDSVSGIISGATLESDFAASPYTVVMNVSDASGATAITPAQFTLTVDLVNLPPVVTGSLLSIPADTVLNGSLTSFATDPENCGCLTFKDVSTTTATSFGDVVINSDGSFVYTPNAGYNGADSFTYVATDAGAYPKESNEGVIQIKVGIVTGETYAGSNFTMLDSTGANSTGGANDVVASWDGLFNTDVSDTDFSHMTLSSITPYLGIVWKAHHIRVFGPGTYTFDTSCTVADLEAGISDCQHPLETGQTERYITITVDSGQIGGHILFDYGINLNIDVVNVWDKNSEFDVSNNPGTGVLFNGLGYGPYPWSGPPSATTEWRMASSDDDGDGIPGIPMVDGKFPNFSASFNLDIVTAGSNFTMLDSTGANSTGGANDVVASWDGLFNTDVSDTDFSHMTLSSITPYLGIVWKAHHIRVFGPGTYTFDTSCTVADLDAGISDCLHPLETGQTERYITITVDNGQIGGHILFDYGINLNIDVVNVWDKNSEFDVSNNPGTGVLFNGLGYGPYPWSGPPSATTEWRMASSDDDGDGIPGVPMVDGKFPNFSASFNIFVGSGKPCIPTKENHHCGKFEENEVVDDPDLGGGSAFGLAAIYLLWLGMRFGYRRK